MKKLSAQIQSRLHQQFKTILTYQQNALQDMELLSPYIDNLSLVGYEDMPAHYFDDPYDFSRPAKRIAEYDQQNDTYTALAMEKIDNTIYAEIDYLAFHMQHQNQLGVAEVKSRMTELVKHVDNFQQDFESLATWINSKEEEYSPALVVKHTRHINHKRLSGPVEEMVYEGLLIAYLDAAEAFIQHTDLHTSMIVIHLSGPENKPGDMQHKKSFQAIAEELEASRNLLGMAVRLCPEIRMAPEPAPRTLVKRPSNKLN